MILSLSIIAYTVNVLVIFIEIIVKEYWLASSYSLVLFWMWISFKWEDRYDDMRKYEGT